MLRILLLGLLVVVSMQSPTGLSFNNQNEMIEYINSLEGITWKAGKNFDDSYNLEDIKRLMGVPQNQVVPDVEYSEPPEVDISEIPESFDSREAWPTCDSIKEVRDQGTCGSCWAFATVEAISDRICVASNGKQQVEISAEDLVSCCSSCGFGCNGGYPESAWSYYQHTGLVSGGLYGSKKGCRPYTIAACEHHTTGHLPPCGKSIEPTPKCQKQCIAGYNITYNEDKHYGSKTYHFSNDNQKLQADIMQNGPVVATYQVFEDFLSYKSGVYYHVTGPSAGYHAVKIIGWGVDNGVDYWLVANSWNEDWGDKGLFKIRRGRDDCGFEQQISAGLPKL
ncbi:cathepsin B-like [Oppia nitens]|uniref:cathepsin B-like n=1 Tax=Oppia nitens TaxID=1686743 RepID=UPI0023DC059C|nr:cathepsin B-like [Oppia nitens]